MLFQRFWETYRAAIPQPLAEKWDGKDDSVDAFPDVELGADDDSELVDVD